MTEAKETRRQILIRVVSGLIILILATSASLAMVKIKERLDFKKIRWSLRVGDYEWQSCLMRFGGGQNTRSSARPFNLVISSARLNDGGITSVLKVDGMIEKCRAHIVFGFEEESKRYFTAGLGGDGAAFSIGSQDGRSDWQSLAKSGVLTDVETSRFYELRLEIRNGAASLAVDGDKRMTAYVGTLDRAARVGVLVEGCEGAEFLCTEFSK